LSNWHTWTTLKKLVVPHRKIEKTNTDPHNTRLHFGQQSLYHWSSQPK
jgi:hypothetical protein